MQFDVGSLTMTEIIRLQDLLSRELTRRFARAQALALSDIVGSTAYFAEHGDEAGRKLQQRHGDLVREALREAPFGRLVDQVGDGAFLCFPTVGDACRTLVALLELLDRDNAARPKKHELHLRIGLHWGTVLTDDVQVTGDAVNLAARVMEIAEPGEIRLTRDAYLELPSANRLMCVAMPPVTLKGIPRPVETLRLDWRDRSFIPDLVRIEETGEELPLPSLETITFGRLKQSGGVQGNAIVLTLPDEQKAKQISRWHFELRRRPDGMVLRQLSNQSTEVDGHAVPVGTEVPIKGGSVVRVGRVMTLTFESTAGAKAWDEVTVGP